MTKSFSNFPSSNSKNKRRNVKNNSADNVDKLIENADNIMDNLSMEDFQKVLEQVTDYSLPQSKKSPLVQKLNQQYAKEDNCLEAMFDINVKASQSPECCSNRNVCNDLIDETAKNDQFVGELNHLQKLETFCETFDNNCNSANASLTNSLLNNWDSKPSEQNNGSQSCSEPIYSSLPTPNSSESSQAIIHNHHLSDNSNKNCDNSNCESCPQRSNLFFRLPIYNEPKIEMKDYSKRAQIVEYTTALSLNENNTTDTSQLKIDSVDTQFAENCLNELNDTNCNNSSDCLNQYQNIDDKQSNRTLSLSTLSTSDGHISSSCFDSGDKSSNNHLNSNYLKKGSTSSSTQSNIQTNGKSEINNYLTQKKRKKPEKGKLTQDCEGYVGYRDIQFLTNYIAGDSEISESMRETAINSNSKEMNGRKKDKKELNELNVVKKRNGKEISNEAINMNIEQSANDSNDLTNDKNNNNLLSATNNNIIPTNHQSSIRKESIDLSIKVISSSNEASTDNINNPSGNRSTNKQQPTEKRNDKVTSNKNASLSSRKSSANLEISNNSQKSSDDGQSPTIATKIVSNGLSGSDFDSVDCTQSDPEDKESGFKIVKYKQLRRKKQKSKIGADLSKSNKKDQQNKTSPNPATARGYESESDYCAVEGRKKGGLERDNQNEVKQLLEYKDALSKVPVLSDDPPTKGKRSKKIEDKLDDYNNYYPSVQETFLVSPPAIINNPVTQSKISYAAIAKMHYSNSSTSSVQNTSNTSSNNSNHSNNGNLTLVQTNQTNTNQEQNTNGSKKENRKKNPANNLENKSPKANKSINLNELKTEVNRTESANRSKDDKQPQELTNSKQAKKQINKLHKSEPSETMREEKSTTAELSYDSSRTISIDTNEIPSVISSKSDSFNSTNQPPVIMFDSKNIDENSTFTFGFFDENAQFQTNVVEDQSEQFLINVNSVNFISKESNVNQQQSQMETNINTENEPKIDEKIDAMKSEIMTTGTSVSISDILNSPINGTNISNSSSSTLNSNTPIHEGTYIMDHDGGDNLTKKVQDKSNNASIVSKTLNEITSYNLNKFKEKIPSPIDHHVYLTQSNIRYSKPTRPEFTCNVAYVQAVNYVRRAWSDAAHSKPIFLKYDGPIRWEQIESNFNDTSMNLIAHIPTFN